MTRVDRYLLREIAIPLGVSVAVVVLLVFLFQARRLAAAALGFGLTLGDAAVIFGAALPPFLVLAVPIAYLFSVLVGLGRLSQDLELVALRAAGASPLRLAVVPVAFGAVISAVCLPLAYHGEPFGLGMLRARLIDVGLRNLAGALRPGVFNEDFEGSALYAAEAEGEQLENVLLFDERQADRPLLVTAKAGRFEASAAGLVFSLEEGEVHLAQSAAEGPYDRLAFGRASLGLDAGKELGERTKFISPIGELESPELLRVARSRGPLDPFGRRLEKIYWRRFAFPAMALVFGVVGAAIGLTASRGARAQSALLGLGAVLGYYLLTRLADLLVVKVPGTALAGAVLPNAAVLFVALAALLAAGRGPR